jgi:hypothetical protein
VIGSPAHADIGPLNVQVVLAAFNFKCVYHIAAAIGALNEHISNQTAGKSVKESNGLAFALSQCQKSMSILRCCTESATDPSK